MLIIRKRIFLAVLVLTILVSAAASVQFAYFAAANPGGSSVPELAMPVEYLNYTITWVNGTLWAKIDGTYPIQMLKQPDCPLPDELPMHYPTPPGTTNVKVWLNDTELSWSNFTRYNPSGLHHTAIGDWAVISSVLSPVSEFFTMRIHYEHPLEIVNGSYLFLYDLNISPYLSEESSNSTAYFTIRMETNSTNLQAFTTGTIDGAWTPIEFTVSKEGATNTVKIKMHSELSKPLLGDLVVMFSDAVIPEVSFWIIPIFLGAAVLVGMVLKVSGKRLFHFRPRG